MFNMMKLKVIAVLVGVTMSGAASAWTWELVTTVGTVEATYIPSIVSFQTTPMPAACTTGWLVWVSRGANENQQIANSKSVFGALVAAQSSMNTLHMYGTGCNVEYLHLNAF